MKTIPTFAREENRRRNAEARRALEKPTPQQRKALEDGADELLKAMMGGVEQ